MGYNKTHFDTLHVTSRVSDKMHDLSAGYAEVQGLYVSGTTIITGSTVCLSNLTVSGNLIGGSKFTGSYSFQGTGASTGVTVSGMAASDYVFATPKYACTVNDVLATSAYSGGFNVIRPNTSGTSGLAFDWVVIRPAS